MSRTRPVVRLLAAACGCVLGAGVLSVTAVQAEPAPSFLGYALTAQAAGAQVTEDQPTATTHPEAETEVPLAQVSLTSGPVGYALSSLAWPGALAANAGTLLVLAGAPVPPDQAATLNYPVRAETRTGGPPSVTNSSVPGVVMSASVAERRSASQAVLDAAAAAPTLTLGRTTVAASADLGSTSVVATASATVSDLSLADGAVRLRSLVSTATARSDGRRASADGETVVSGLEVAGVPVVVDEQGVTVDTTVVPPDPTLAATVESTLAQLGMTVLLSAPSQRLDGGAVSHDAGSLIVLWKPPGTSSDITVVLGGARVTASAVPADGSVVPPAAPEPPAAPGTPPSGTGSTLPPPDLAGAPVPTPVDVPGAVAPPVGPATTTVAARLLSGSPAPAGAAALAALAAALLVAAMLRLPVLLAAPASPCPTPRRSS